jgi:hypothetical protein
MAQKYARHGTTPSHYRLALRQQSQVALREIIGGSFEQKCGAIGHERYFRFVLRSRHRLGRLHRSTLAVARPATKLLRKHKYNRIGFPDQAFDALPPILKGGEPGRSWLLDHVCFAPKADLTNRKQKSLRSAVYAPIVDVIRDRSRLTPSSPPSTLARQSCARA